MSLARERMYVPDETVTAIFIKGGANSINSKLLISTDLLGSANILPLRASLYAGDPLIFMAEYLGGLCLIFPVNFFRTFSIVSLLTFVGSPTVINCPSLSSVELFLPSSMVARY